MSAEKRSVSAPAELFAQADQRKAQLGYSTFSDYIQALIRADTVAGGAHLREASDILAAAHQQTIAAVETSYGKKSKPRKK